MGIVAVLVNNVTETQDIQFLLSSFTRRVHREKDWPGNQTSEEAYSGADLEVAK